MGSMDSWIQRDLLFKGHSKTMVVGIFIAIPRGEYFDVSSNEHPFIDRLWPSIQQRILDDGITSIY